MSNSRPIAAVVGSTGLQGSSVVKALSAAGYQVRALTRSPSSPSALALAGAHVHPFAFDITDKGSVERAFATAEVVFAMPLTDHLRVVSPLGTYVKPEGALDEEEQGKRLADVAKAAGVKTFFWSTVVFSDEYLKHPFTEGIVPQVNVNTYLKEIGLPYVNLSLGFFNENFINSKRVTLESDGKVLYTLIFGKVDVVVHPHFSVAHDLGPIVALLAANFEAAKLDQKTITVAERVYSNQEVIKIIEKVTGRATIFKSGDGITPNKDSPIEHFARAMTSVSYLDPSLIPDKTLSDLGFTFQTLEEYVREELVPALGL